MSKTWDTYRSAAHHYERAAHHFLEAAKYNEAEELEKAAHHAYLAHGHAQQAARHGAAGARLHTQRWESAAPHPSARWDGVDEEAGVEHILVPTPC